MIAFFTWAGETVGQVHNLTAYLKAPYSTRYFGRALGMDGNLVVVGAAQDNRVQYEAGAAFVYRRGPQGWEFEATLRAAIADREDRFGHSVSVSGNTIAVGALREDSRSSSINGDAADSSQPSSGAAYVFVYDGTQWIQQAYLKSAQPSTGGGFGTAVALSGDTLVVSATGEPTDGVYVFVRAGTNWTRQARLTPTTTGADEGFGTSLALGGDRLVIGASRGVWPPTTSGVTSGKAYVFDRSGTNWTQTAEIGPSDPDESDHFGTSVALSGDTLAVGAVFEDGGDRGGGANPADDSRDQSGAVYLFGLTNGTWQQLAYLKAENADAGDHFGLSVALSGPRLLVGAPGEDSDAEGVNGNAASGRAYNSGAAYLFAGSGTNWAQTMYLKSPRTTNEHSFGEVVALNGTTALIGDGWENSPAIGVNGDFDVRGTGDYGAAFVMDVAIEPTRPRIEVMGLGIFDRFRSVTNDVSLYSFLNGTDFRTVPAYCGAKTNTFMITNSGAATLILSRARVNGTQFRITRPPPRLIGPGCSASFDVAFAPDGVRSSFSATVTLDSNDPDTSRFAIRMRGEGTGETFRSRIDNFDFPLNAQIRGLALQGNDRILFARSSYTWSGLNLGWIGGARFNGSIDTNYITPSGSGGPSFLPMQFDGSVLVAGYGRVRADGTLDPAFTNELSGNSFRAFEADGSAIFQSRVSGINYRLRRLLPNGSWDDRFQVETYWHVNAVVVQPDGRLVIGGRFERVDNENRRYLVRLHPDGSLDDSFRAVINDEVFGVVAESDGSFLIWGSYYSVGGYFLSGLARIRSDGNVDPFFNPEVSGAIRSVVLQADGRILVAADRIERFLPDGRRDYWDAPSELSTYDALALQRNGKILVGGDTSAAPFSGGTALVRLNNGPAIDELQVSTNGIYWRRCGTAPEIDAAEFVITGGQGTNIWRTGTAERTTNGWWLAANDLPPVGTVVARGRTHSGYQAHSVGYVESQLYYSIRPEPEIAVLGSGHEIRSGSTNGSGTYFGSVNGFPHPATNYFVIINHGVRDLLLDEVRIEGDSREFRIALAPASVIEPGNSSLIGIAFDPVGVGRRSARVVIDNNDFNEGEFWFEVSGYRSGTPRAELFWNQLPVDLGTTPSPTNGTDFGELEVGRETATQVFRIANTGNARLWFGVPEISGTAAADFTGNANVLSVDPGAVGEFSIHFTPGATGARSALVNITNNGFESLDFEVLGRGRIAAPPSYALEAYLKGSGSVPRSVFGYSVAMSGDIAVVGAPWRDSGMAFVFVRDGTNWVREAQLLPHDPIRGAGFGHAVAITGERIAVGARDALQNNPITGQDENVGAVYVFEREGTNWVERSRFQAAAPEAGAGFGAALAIWDDRIVVGAPFEDGEENTSAGAAYVFELVGGDWQQRQRLVEPVEGTYFGSAVDVSGNRLVVGARNSGTNNAGRAYVFERGRNRWQLDAELSASHGDPSDRFGVAVSIHQDVIAIGAGGEDGGRTGVGADQADNSHSNSGAVYMFEKQGADWVETAYLKKSAATPAASFGDSVSLRHHRLLIGAKTLRQVGALFLFVRDGSTWLEQLEIASPNPDVRDEFGEQVALGEGALIAGARWEDGDPANGNQLDFANGVSDAGAAYVFGTERDELVVRSRGGVIANGDLNPNFADHTDFGRANVATAGRTNVFAISNRGTNDVAIGAPVIVGAGAAQFRVLSNPMANLPPGDTTELVIVFEPNAVGRHDATVAWSNAPVRGAFSFAFAITGEGVSEPELSLSARGVKIFRGDGVPSAADGSDFGRVHLYFGRATNTVVIRNRAGTTLDVAAPTLAGDHPEDFTIEGGAAVSLSPGETASFDVVFDPTRVRRSRATVRIASNDPDGPFEFAVGGAGSLLVAPRSSIPAYLKAEIPGPDRFGERLAMSGDTLVVSASYDDSQATHGDRALLNSGAVHVFVWDGAEWRLQAYLKAPEPQRNHYFGTRVALEGNTLAISARESVFVFERTGANWSHHATLRADNGETSDLFGQGLALSGDVLIAGARYEDGGDAGVNGDGSDNSVASSGAAYVFVRDGGEWRQQAYLKSPQPIAGDQFGVSVAAFGDRVVVGADGVDSGPREDERGDPLYVNWETGAAYVYQRQGTNWVWDATLLPDDTIPSTATAFGSSVALVGNWIAVGSTRDYSNQAATVGGSVYVFELVGSSWVRHSRIVPPVPDRWDRFGSALAFSGNRLAIGAPYESGSSVGIGGDPFDNSAGGSGAVYVYEFTDGMWMRQTYVKSINTEPGDGFGVSVHLEGDLLVVGASAEDSASGGIDGDETDNSESTAGAVYVYDLGLSPMPRLRVTGNGMLITNGTAVTTPLNATGFDSQPVLSGPLTNRFLVHNDGNGLLTLTPLQSSDTNGVFTIAEPANRSIGPGDEWEFGVVFDPANPGPQSAEISFNSTDPDQGTFRFRVGGAGLSAPDIRVLGNGRVITNGAASARAEDFTDFGPVFVHAATRIQRFAITNGGAAELLLSTPVIGGANADQFQFLLNPESSVPPGGSTPFAIIYNPADTNMATATVTIGNNTATNSNYTFVLGGLGIDQPPPRELNEARLKASARRSYDYFGRAVAIDDDTAVVGAPGLRTGQNTTGSAYVFIRRGTNWIQQARLVGGLDGQFGSAVDISGDRIVIGSPYDDATVRGLSSPPDSGGAYVYERHGTNWTRVAFLKASNADADDEFGIAVAISGDTVVVGARKEDSASQAVNGDQVNNDKSAAGAAYVFTQVGSNWLQQAYLKASNAGSGDWFGAAVDIHGDTIVVGATGEDSSNKGSVQTQPTFTTSNDSGAAYVFRRQGGNWWQSSFLKAATTEPGDNFGAAVSVFGDRIAVGAPNDDSFTSIAVNGLPPGTTLRDTGAVYVFAQEGSFATNWARQATIHVHNRAADDEFGASVSLHEDVLLIGAPGKGQGGSYLYSEYRSVWRPESFLPPPAGSSASQFGTAGAVFGDHVVIGSPYEHGVPLPGSYSTVYYEGTAYVFQLNRSGPGPARLHLAGNGERISSGDESPSLLDATDFGLVDISAGPRTNTYHIENNGGTNLYLLAPQLAGAAEFTLAAGPPIMIPPQGTGTLSVAFDPVYVGARRATITLPNNASGSDPFRFDLSGFGTSASSPRIEVLGRGHAITNGNISTDRGNGTDFGAVVAAEHSMTNVFVISNSGPLHLVLDLPRLTGSAAFALAGVPDAILPPGGSTVFAVVFEPTGFGLHQATVTIPSNDQGAADFVIHLSGGGLGLSSIGVWSSDVLTSNDAPPPLPGGPSHFGTHSLYGVRVTNSFVITNVGNTNLLLATPHIVGAAAAEFEIVTAPDSPIPPFGAAALRVAFDPAIPGERLASVFLTNNSPNDNPFILNLAGTGDGRPVILSHPESRTLEEGETLLLSVIALGDALEYHWRFNGARFLAGGAHQIVIPNIQLAQAGHYDVIVSNAFGSRLGSSAEITVTLPAVAPEIVEQPQSLAVPVGWFSSLRVVATGTPPLTYQWFRGGEPLAGHVSPILTLGSAQTNFTGDYTVSVSNRRGSVTSAVARLTVDLPRSPRIIRQPAGGTILEGNHPALVVLADGFPPPAYAWMKDSLPIPGATNAILLLRDFQTTNAGAYTVSLSNVVGSVVSAPATLVTGYLPKFDLLPNDQLVTPGSSVLFWAMASGTQPIFYQWRHNGSDIPGQQSRFLNLSAAKRSDSGIYHLLASNHLGVTLSLPIQLRVVHPQQMREPLRLDHGRIRISFGDFDDGPMTADRIAGFQVYSTDALRPGAWQLLTNQLVLTNGLLRFDHHVGTNSPGRFYRVIER